MYIVYEVFEDGKKFPLYENEDRFTCEVWSENNAECTNALHIKKSHLEIQEV